MLVITEIKLGLEEDENKLKEHIKKILHTSDNSFDYEIVKKSLDSRKEPYFSYQVHVKINNENKYLKYKNVSLIEEKPLYIKHVDTAIRPIIVGYGPSGIFSAMYFIDSGIKPIIIEKGKRINERRKDVEKFFKEGIFNPDSNVQFGEGGAGTFSDAKLTTRIKSPYITYILDTFVRFGANPKIKYLAHPHIGTDSIQIIISNITNYLIEKGASFYFEEEVEELLLNNNHELIGVKTNKDSYYSNYCLLAIGHSSQKLIQTLYRQNVYIESKDFALGFRVEHPQSLIDRSQYHNLVSEKLEPSEYFLRYKDERGVWSFCMCPGGFVIPSNSEPKTIVTNGMSYSDRNNQLANSAILIQKTKSDEPLLGFDYLNHYEKKAYEIDDSYKAVAQNIKDYLNNKTNPLIFKSSYPLDTKIVNFNDFFEEEDNIIFKKALAYFDSKINGFIENGIMIGPETRSSCPCRITRDENSESINTKGLFPTGEGAGYGGGIMSCGLDGIRSAIAIINKLSV